MVMFPFDRGVMLICSTWCYGDLLDSYMVFLWSTYILRGVNFDLLVSYMVVWWFARFIRGVMVNCSFPTLCFCVSACLLRGVMLNCLFYTWCYGDLHISYVVLWRFFFLRSGMVICSFHICYNGDLLYSNVVFWWSACFLLRVFVTGFLLLCVMVIYLFRTWCYG